MRASRIVVPAAVIGLLSTGSAPAGAVGPATQVRVSPELRFGRLPIDWAAEERPLAASVKNEGPAQLAVTSSALEGENATDFRIASDGCSGQIVAPGASCVITIQFVPSRIGSSAARLVIADNGQEGSQSVALSGTLLGCTSPCRLLLSGPPESEPTPTPQSPTVAGVAPVAVAVLSDAHFVHPVLISKRHRIRTHAVVSYRDSLPALTTFTLQKRISGHVSGGRCRAGTARGHALRCSHLLALGSFEHRDVAGTNTVSLGGSARHRALGVGRYVVEATPSSNGQVGSTVRLQLNVIG